MEIAVDNGGQTPLLDGLLTFCCLLRELLLLTLWHLTDFFSAGPVRARFTMCLIMALVGTCRGSFMSFPGGNSVILKLGLGKFETISQSFRQLMNHVT